MALTTTDCTKILAAAKATDQIFMVGQVLRFMYPYRYAAKFISDAGHADIQRCVLRRQAGYPEWGGWLTQYDRSGGAILDLLSHDLDQVLSLFGPPRSAYATSTGPIDTMHARLNYESGLVVEVEGGWLPTGVPFSASFEIQTNDSLLTYRDDALILSHGDENKSIEIPKHDPYFDEIAYFIDCCRRNAAPTLCLPEESAQAVELSLQLRASRDAGGKEFTWQPQ
jgi:predicted dehydrogenase